ncbi:MAG: oligopeptide transporter, OPT family [Calditrichia bacterium]
MSKKFTPYVPADKEMPEGTIRAIILGLIMTAVLGAANAYLGLKAGMTIAATYPAAVLGMAILRLFKGSILEENMARTIGSIGESVAAGAIFTIPAFLIAGIWEEMGTLTHYLESSAIMILGSLVGIFFVTMLRRVMVADEELPFPESVAAAEIHKAGRSGGTGAALLFGAMGLGAFIKLLDEFHVFAHRAEKFVHFDKAPVKFDVNGSEKALDVGGGALLSTFAVSPAYIGVGYIIGPVLAALNFTGGLLAWGLFVPLLLYFVGPEVAAGTTLTDAAWTDAAYGVWGSIVRPIAIGGMLMSAIYTMWKMRGSLAQGIKRSIDDLKKAAHADHTVSRIDKDISFKIVFPGLIITTILIFFLYYYFSGSLFSSLVAAVVMVVAGFFFAAVSGYLVGIIGSSNNPISGLTLTTLIVAALLMVLLGVSGQEGVAVVLGVAAVICVAAAVAGEMLQDLKVGHLLGGTPHKMQWGDIAGIGVAGLVMFLPILILHQGDVNMGGPGLGGPALPAPQASLMAILAKGIVAQQMAWPLIIVGIVMAIGFILVKVKSPMLVFVGMYLPLETTFAIFVGGLIKGIVQKISEKRNHNEEKKSIIENIGVLLSSGFIAGEALMGLVFAGLAFGEFDLKKLYVFDEPSFFTSLLVLAILATIMVMVPLRKADETK